MSAPVPPRLWYKPGAHVVFADGQLADGPHGLVCYTRADIAADRSAAQVAAARTEALREALAVFKRCGHWMGHDPEIGPLGCDMEGTDEGCACLHMSNAIHALIQEEKING